MNDKTTIKRITGATLALLLAGTTPAWAGGDHDHDHEGDGHAMHGDEHGHGAMMGGGMKHGDMDHDHKGMDHDHKGGHGAMGEMFLKEKMIDGYKVTFHVMKAKPGMEMGGSHHLMVKVERGGKPVKGVVMNTKVKHPNGSAETKKAKPMGDWLMAAYDLGHPGKHQLMILFKTPDGEKHKGGVYYP